MIRVIKMKEQQREISNPRKINSSKNEWRVFFQPFTRFFCFKDTRKNVVLLLLLSLLSSLSAYFFGAFVSTYQYWALGISLVVLPTAVIFTSKQIHIISSSAIKEYFHRPFSFSLAQFLFAVVLPVLLSGITLFFVLRLENMEIFAQGNWVSLIPITLANCYFAYLVFFHNPIMRGRKGE